MEEKRMEKYAAYKNSGVEWLGEIPEHWEVNRLKHVCGINANTLPESTNKNFQFQYVDIGAVTYEEGIILTEKFNFKNSPSRARRIAMENDTIVSTVRTYLKAIDFINKEKSSFIYSTGFGVLSPNTTILNPKFFSLFIKSNAFTNQVDRMAKGMSYPAINSTELGHISIILPALEEQTAFAAFLDRKTALIDKAIAIKQQQIELLKERRQILIHRAVTRGLNPNVKMKDSGVEWIGEIPEGWEVKRLKYLGLIKYGLGQPPKEKENGLPLIRATNVERGKIVETGLIFVDPAYIPWERDPMLKENDIIIVRSGAYTADSAIVTGKYVGAIAGYDMVFTPQNVNPRFISFALLADYILFEQLYLVRMRAAQPHLNAEELGETLVIYPPVEEQFNISDHIEFVTNKISVSISMKFTEIEKLKEYKASLINSVVTGKIKVK